MWVRLQLQSLVLVHCNIVNKDDQGNSRVLYVFVPNKSFGQLLEISPKNFIFLKPFNSEFSYTEVWFTDQNSKPLEVEDKINIILVITEQRNKSVLFILNLFCRVEIITSKFLQVSFTFKFMVCSVQLVKKQF